MKSKCVLYFFLLLNCQSPCQAHVCNPQTGDLDLKFDYETLDVVKAKIPETQSSEKSKATSSQEVDLSNGTIDIIKNMPMPSDEEVADPYQQGRTYSYSTEMSQNNGGFSASRFLESPCYEKLGFSPYSDLDWLNKEYEDCESARRWTIGWQIGAGALLAGFLYLLFYLSRRSSKSAS